jgi:ribosomal protein S11
VRSNGTNANKIFVNVTNFKGQTIIKFSSGLIQKSGSKKQIKSNAVAKWIIEKLDFFLRNNFDCVKLIIKGHKSIMAYLKEFKRKKLLTKWATRIVDFQAIIPLVHNGCRPPKKRRI